MAGGAGGDAVVSSPVFLMRRLLDRLYLGAGALAGLCLVMMALLILGQIVGRWFGVVIPSTEDFSGFLLAAAAIKPSCTAAGRRLNALALTITIFFGIHAWVSV